MFDSDTKFTKKTDISLNFFSIKIIKRFNQTMSGVSTFQMLKLSQPKPYVTLVELNRPTKLNAMNQQLFK